MRNDITERKITEAMQNSGAVFIDNGDEIGNVNRKQKAWLASGGETDRHTALM